MSDDRFSDPQPDPPSKPRQRPPRDYPLLTTPPSRRRHVTAEELDAFLEELRKKP